MENLKKIIDNTNEWDLYNVFFLNKDIKIKKIFGKRAFF